MFVHFRYHIREHLLYGTVLYQCALERDIELFEAGDMTEVGEKGLSLRSVLYFGAVRSD